jgi:hypothetical protein
MLAYPAVPAQQIDLPALEAFPWLVHADPAPSAAPDGNGNPGRSSGKFLIHAAIAVALAALCGGAFSLMSGVVEEPAPLVQPASLPQGITSPATSAAADADTADTATGSATMAEARQALIIEQERTARDAQAARMQPTGATGNPSPALRLNPSPADGQAFANETASTTTTPPPPVADSPASAATLQAYRSAMDESRATVREVIRLESRQRPQRDASAEEQTGYLLRKQNAAAARNYRKYLDTLARSMRGTQSETVAQQSLEKARQTLGYLKGMLADSQGSLR